MAPSRNSSRGNLSRDSVGSRKSSLSKYLPSFIDRLMGQSVAVEPDHVLTSRSRSYLGDFGPRASASRSAMPPRSRSPRSEDLSRYNPSTGNLRHDEAVSSPKKSRVDISRPVSGYGFGIERSSAFSFLPPQRQTPARLSDESSFEDHRLLQSASRSTQNLVRAQVDEYLSSKLSSLIRLEILKAVSEGVIQGQSSAKRPQARRFDWLNREALARRLEPFNVGTIEANDYQNDYNERALDETDFHESAFMTTNTHSHPVETAKTGEPSHLHSRLDPWSLRSQIGSCPPLPRCGVPQTGLEFVSGFHSMDWVYANIQKDDWLSTPLPCLSLADKDIKHALRARMDEYQRRVSALPDNEFAIIDGLVLTLQRSMHYRKEVYIATCAGEDYEIERCRKDLQAKKKMGLVGCEEAAETMRDRREMVAKNKKIALRVANDAIMKVMESSIEKQLEVFQRNEKSADAIPLAQEEGQEMEVDSTAQPCTLDEGGSEITVEAGPVCEAKKTKKIKAVSKNQATKVQKKKSSTKTRPINASRCG